MTLTNFEVFTLFAAAMLDDDTAALARQVVEDAEAHNVRVAEMALEEYRNDPSTAITWEEAKAILLAGDAAQADEQDTAHLQYMDELFSIEQCDHPCRDYFELGSCKCTSHKSVWLEEDER